MFSAYAIPHLLTKIASVLIIGYAIYIAIRLRNAEKHKPGAFTETYVEYLQKMRAYILIQKQLLDSVIYWYILPGMFFTMLFVLGFGITGRLIPILKMTVVNIGLAVTTYYLNKRAVQKELVPRLEKIEALIKVLEGDKN
jgi:hypothetical protein